MQNLASCWLHYIHPYSQISFFSLNSDATIRWRRRRRRCYHHWSPLLRSSWFQWHLNSSFQDYIPNIRTERLHVQKSPYPLGRGGATWAIVFSLLFWNSLRPPTEWLHKVCVRICSGWTFAKKSKMLSMKRKRQNRMRKARNVRINTGRGGNRHRHRHLEHQKQQKRVIQTEMVKKTWKKQWTHQKHWKKTGGNELG